MGLFVLCMKGDNLSKLKAARDNLKLSLKVFGENYLIEDFALSYLNQVIEDFEEQVKGEVNDK